MRRIIEAPTFGRPFDLTYLRFDDDKHKIVIDSHFVNWGLVAEFDHACEHKLRWLGRDIKPLVAAAFVILRRKVQTLSCSSTAYLLTIVASSRLIFFLWAACCSRGKMNNKMRSGQVYFRPAKPSGTVSTTTPNGVSIPWSDLTDPTESVPVPDGVAGCPVCVQS